LWVDVESGPRWKLNKKIHRSLAHELRKDPELTAELDNMVDEIFSMFSSTNANELFPNFREDFVRTTGRQNRLHARKQARLTSTRRERRLKKRKTRDSKHSKKDKLRKKTKTSTKRGAIRGALYEGAFQKLLDSIPNASRCLETIESPMGERCRPDGWYEIQGLLNIPIEFKTIGSGMFQINSMRKMLEQSREQGLIAQYANLQKILDKNDAV
jgi:hypothetical protein